MQTRLPFIYLASVLVAIGPLACDAGGGGLVDGGGSTGAATGGAGSIDLGNDGGSNGDGDLDILKDQPSTAACADGILDDDEACDDGNESSGDGCGDNCRYIEDGFVCPEAGQPCRPYAKCGDAALVFPEQCDDGGLVPGDGCSATCKVEIGFKCEGNPSTCSPTTCGDGIAEGAEICDDGNTAPFDGCSVICQGEPDCSGEGACRSSCGDGLVIGEEECDDGNATPNDGCSETCKFEPGYECTQASACPEGEADCPLELPIVFRDFNTSHSDFQEADPPGTENRPCDGFSEGMVQDTLGADGKPVFASAPASACVSNFGDWYVDSGESSTILGTIMLYPNGEGGYVNRFGPNGEPFLTAVKTPSEQSAGSTIAECSTTCAARARDGQAPFEGEGHLRCDDLCRPLVEQANQLRSNQLNQLENQLTQLENQLTQAEGQADPDAAAIASLEADIADLEADIVAMEEQILDVEAEAAQCDTDCEVELAARTELCTAECAPCSYDMSAFCIGGELRELDGNPLFFPVDDHPDAMTPAASYSPARIPAQMYMGLGWPWEDKSCGLDDTCTSDLTHNFHFTSEIAYWFEYTEGLAADFSFVGDDDVWVFMNGQLIIDLGGIHVPLAGEFSLGADGAVTSRAWQPEDPGVDTDVVEQLASDQTTAAALGLEDGGVYEIKVFHAERKPEGSSFQLTLSGFNTARSECGFICGDGILASGEQCDEGVDGNMGGHNQCKSDCTLGSYCGDGIVQSEEGEACDDGDPARPADCFGCRRVVIR